MENLPKYYTTLFNAVTDAIELISHSEVSEAMACLVAAQQKAEEIYISEPPLCKGRWQREALTEGLFECNYPLSQPCG